jgi:phosphotransferase system enzyme I (PtsI)
MLPLIVSVAEVRRARELLELAAKELTERGTPHRASVPLGVMVETPAAAVAADTFAGEAEFFSVGTNDLTQYTLAVDRGNANIADRFTPLHPGVLRLIQRTVAVGAEHGIDVTVCGEMASQPLMAFALIGLGVRQLSVSPRAVPLMKRLACAIAISDAERAAAHAITARTAADAERVLARHLAESAAGDPFLHDGLSDSS